MKTRINKILMIAATLLFVASGVAFAHDRNDRNHKPAKKAYGHYKVQKKHPVWNTKQFKYKRQIPHRYTYKKFRGHRYYYDHHRRPASRRTVVYKPVKKDPVVVFKIVLKDRK